MTLALIQIELKGTPTWVAINSSDAARGMIASKVVFVNNPSLWDRKIILVALRLDGGVFHIDSLTEKSTNDEEITE